MKDAPPGYHLSFDRHIRRWKWREQATGRESEATFTSRGACCHDAYEQLRATRSEGGGGQYTAGAT